MTSKTTRASRPSQITCSKRIEWDSAHRLLNHEGACASLHGHRYEAIIVVRAEQLDRVGRVVDFSVIKKEVGGWANRNWDHTAILNSRDGLLEFLRHEVSVDGRQRAPYVMDDDPTAENMAVELLAKARSLLGHLPIDVVEVTIYETPSSWATAR